MSIESASSLDLSSDSESDEIFLGKDEQDGAGQSDEDSLGLELSAMEQRTAPSGRKTSQRITDNSDDDF